ncbi:MAG: metallophosphatase family protein [Myxococcota bacterium]|nr:metallophosphatase family protein [Myxococcota bacterium]MDW8362128.1 metallophosphoesterase family protein [Myxococcales bacterium]
MKPVPLDRPAAFLSDVHGNARALDAVLNELRTLGIEHIFVAGDLLFGGDEPLRTWRRLREVGARCVRGASDTALATIDPASLRPCDDRERAQAERFARTRAALGDLVCAELRRLPDMLRIPMIDGGEIVLVHGSPVDPLVEIGFELDDEEIAARIGDDPADVVVCGASHVPFDRMVGEVRVVNVGSVGQAPGGGHAHYTVLTPRYGGPLVEQYHVAY